MNVIVPAKTTRERIVPAVGFSVLIPGLGHFLAGERNAGVIWFAVCQLTLMLGVMLAGHTQNDHGFMVELGSMKVLFVLLPECGNFLATQLLARVYPSIEMGGLNPEHLPWRNLGYILSGMSGVLGMFSAAHAAGLAIVRHEPIRVGEQVPKVQPGRAALLTLLCPGLGHWVTGRRFKAYLLGGSILGLFLLGMALGDFADFDRMRHPYYWAGQMMLGLPGWLIALLSSGARFESVMPYQDAGLLFTTSAGFFNIIAALDAFHRAEQDWLAAGSRVPSKPGSPVGAKS